MKCKVPVKSKSKTRRLSLASGQLLRRGARPATGPSALKSSVALRLATPAVLPWPRAARGQVRVRRPAHGSCEATGPVLGWQLGTLLGPFVMRAGWWQRRRSGPSLIRGWVQHSLPRVAPTRPFWHIGRAWPSPKRRSLLPPRLPQAWPPQAARRRCDPGWRRRSAACGNLPARSTCLRTLRTTKLGKPARVKMKSLQVDSLRVSRSFPPTASAASVRPWRAERALMARTALAGGDQAKVMAKRWSPGGARWPGPQRMQRKTQKHCLCGR
mmetsp:Transcript_88698/g.236104  ORF Transcript_88698/g.236104 Transcript_88698/m.236104 type:complete len:270 (-) Transcript_88698:1032-1841(-)